MNKLVKMLFCTAALFLANADVSAKQRSASTCKISKGRCAPEVRHMIEDTQVYHYLYEQLCPQVETIAGLLDAVVACDTYENLYNFCQGLASSIPHGRIVVTLPDGTVVIDTYLDFCNCDIPSCVDECPDVSTYGCNGYNYFTSKVVNENHNSRVAIMDAQMYPCGVGCETKYSTTVGAVQAYVAIRLGPYLNNLGTVRLSQNVVT